MKHLRLIIYVFEEDTMSTLKVIDGEIGEQNLPKIERGSQTMNMTNSHDHIANHLFSNPSK